MQFYKQNYSERIFAKLLGIYFIFHNSYCIPYLSLFKRCFHRVAVFCKIRSGVPENSKSRVADIVALGGCDGAESNESVAKFRFLVAVLPVRDLHRHAL